MIYLKQSTAKTLRFGPFLDETDGKTAETGLTIAQADIRLSKSGAAFAQTNDSSGATHDEAGWYSLQLDATDTNTVGPLTVAIHESGALPVWREFMVVPANVYDSMMGTDYLQTDAVQIEGSDATDQINAECDTALTDYDAPTKAELDSGLAGLNDLSAAEVNAEVDTALSDYDPPTKAELDSAQSAIQSDIVGLNNVSSAEVEAACDASFATYDPPTKAELDSGLAGLNDLSAAEVNAEVDTALSDYDAPTKAELDTAQAAIQSDISGLNDLSAADVNAEVDTALADIHLDHLLATTYDPASKPGAADALLNELVEDDSGVSRFTANALEEAPTGGSAPTVGEIADAVWDEAKSGHTAGGSFGEEVQAHSLSSEIAALNDLSAADVNAEVDTALADYDPPTKAELDSGLAGLNDLSAAEVNAEVDTALSDYDAPTKAELDTAESNITSAISGLNDLSAADVNAEVDTALADYDPPTKAELDSAVAPLATAAALATVDGIVDAILLDTAEIGTAGAGLTDLGGMSDAMKAEVQTEALDAITAYDPPTKTELDNGFNALNDPSLSQIADAVWDETKAAHAAAGTFGEEVQAHATPSEVNAECDTALTDYDPPTKAELDSGLAALNDPTAADIADAVWDEATADHQGAGTTGKALTDASATADPGAIADAVWDEAKSGHTAAGSFGEEVASHATPSEVNAQCDQALSDYDAPTKAELDSAFAALNDVSTADVESACDSALATYDAPTKAELDAAVGALNDVSVADVTSAATSALNSYDAPTKAELDAALAALNDLSAAQVTAACTSSLNTYDAPTKAELDAAFALLNDLSAADIRTIFGINALNKLDELAQAQPPVNPSIAQAVMLAYMMRRNETISDENNGLIKVKNDAGTVIIQATQVDVNDTFTKGKMAVGV